jgi:membrane-bound serine protease (ClpP class)
MDTLVVWGIILIGVAVLLFMLELFIPSMGIIGVVAAAALVGGVICLFITDTTYGLVATLLALLATPVGFWLAIKLWPETPIARILTLQNPTVRSSDVRVGTEATSARRLEELVGMEGEALTDLRPIGTCRLDGRRVECLASRGMIEAGSRVQVVAADGMHIKVRTVN